MLKSFKRHYMLVAVLMMAVLLTGCFGGGKTEEFKLDITVTLDGGEGQVDKVALLVANKAVTVDKDGKATATVAKGSVAVKATLDGYVSYDKTITVETDTTLAVELKATEKPVDEEAVKKAIAAVKAAGTADAFLKALQDPALGLVDVIPAYKNVYLKIATEGVGNLSALSVTFMDTPEQIQENVVNPGNLFVDNALTAINGAPNTIVIGEQLDILLNTYGVIGFEEIQIAEEHMDIAIDYLVDLVAAVRPVQDIQELQGLLDIAEELVVAIDDFKEEDDLVEAIEKFYKVSDLIDALPAYATKTKLQGDVEEVLKAILEFIDNEYVKVAEEMVFDDEKEVALTFALLEDARKEHKAAVEVVDALRPADSAKLVARLEAVKTAIDTFEAELIADVNEAKDVTELGKALAKLEITASDTELKLFMVTFKDTVFASVKEINDAYKAVSAEDELVQAVNNAKGHTSRMQTALEYLGFAKYNNLKEDNRREVAGRFTFKDAFVQLAEIEAPLYAEIDKYEALISNVNAATTNTDMLTALKAIDEYASLAEAERVLAEKPEEGYLTLADIEEVMEELRV